MDDGEQDLVAEIALDEFAPIGTVLDRTEPDQSVELKYFRGWHSALTSPPWWGRNRTFSISSDEIGCGKVLEHFAKVDSALVTGDDLWRDYTITLSVRQLLATANPTPDDENIRTARTGIVARQRSTRRYYFFCIEGLSQLVLYRRRDEKYVALDRLDLPIDRSRYYELRLQVQGTRLRCFVDGRLTFDVHDEAYASGLCGVRTNTISRVLSTHVHMDCEARRAFRADQAAQASQLEMLRQSIQKPVLSGQFEVGPARIIWAGLPNNRPYTARSVVTDARATGDARLLLLDDATGKGDVLATRKQGRPFKVRLVNAQGEVLWRHDSEGRVKNEPHVVTGDFSGEGNCDVAAVLHDRIVILSGRDGSVVAETTLPPAGPYQEYRGGRTSISKPHAMRLTPRPAPLGLLVREDSAAGGNSLWAYNHRLELLWEAHLTQPKFGHQPWFYDLDQDGREEVLIGYHLLDHDGRVIWQLEGSVYADRMLGARHADNVFLGKLHGEDSDRVTALFAGGSDGLFFADGRTGIVTAHQELGHVQSVQVGRFRTDVPGLQVCAATRWGNFGIMTILDSHGAELCQFQPDFEGETFTPIRWTADHDLLLIARAPHSLGLWDGWGRKVVKLPPDVPTGREGSGLVTVADIDGNGMDELLVIKDGQLRIYNSGEQPR